MPELIRNAKHWLEDKYYPLNMMIHKGDARFRATYQAADTHIWWLYQQELRRMPEED